MFTVLQTLLPRFIPLAIYIALGLLAGRLFSWKGRSVAALLFYLVTPVIVFLGVLKTELSWDLGLIPVSVFVIGTLLCFCTYRSTRRLWDDATPNLLAMAAGSGNTGYFGLPIAFAIFDNQGIGIYLFALIGLELYDASVGYYIMARGQATAREVLPRVARLPVLWAFVLGIVCNIWGVQLSESFAPVESYSRFIYSLLGMMVIGLGLATLRDFAVDWRFVGFSFLTKFIIWPLTILLLYATNLYSKEVFEPLLILAVVPIATNSVVLSSLLGNRTDKAATAVVLSILFAFLYVPLVIAIAL